MRVLGRCARLRQTKAFVITEASVRLLLKPIRFAKIRVVFNDPGESSPKYKP